jgi:hypothetical protein
LPEVLYLRLNIYKIDYTPKKEERMKTVKKREIPAVAELQEEASRLWPAGKGSLTEVRKPCTVKGCRKCASGEKHPILLLVRRDGGRTRTVYVPRAMRDVLRRAIANGRRLEELMADMGEALVKEHQAAKRKARRGDGRQLP